MNRKLQALPAYLMLITANALPVYGAAIGRLVFFQVIYLYWFESLLLIFFDCIRIGAAQGTDMGSSVFANLPDVVSDRTDERPVSRFDEKVTIILQTVIIRVLILLFYLLFIVVFIGYMVTSGSHRQDVGQTMSLRNPFFNTAVFIFLINMAVQLIGGYFITGRYRTDAPRRYAAPVDGRTIFMHLMIVGSAVVHMMLLKNTRMEFIGETLYVGFFMLVRTIIDIRHLSDRYKTQPGEAPVLI